VFVTVHSSAHGTSYDHVRQLKRYDAVQYFNDWSSVLNFVRCLNVIYIP